MSNGTDLAIKIVRIDDVLTQRAAACTIEFGSDGSFSPPPVEFSGAGDVETLTGSTIRPTGSQIELLASYANVAQHTIFKGILETMDNAKDANQDVWTLHLSAMPRLLPHRTRGTKIFDSFYTDGLTATTSQIVLQSFASKVSLALGRNDLPDYVILDTYEIIHQNAVEVANALLAPFNLFDYLKYYVRTDANGLQIIKVDFTAVPTGSVYEVPNVISWERSFEMYMPDNRIGTLDNILLVGGNEIQYRPEEKGPISPSNTGPTPIFRNPVFGNQGGLPPSRYTLHQDYVADTRDSQEQIFFERWTETTTSMAIVVDVYPSSYIASLNTDTHVVTTAEEYYFWASQGYGLIPNDGAGPSTLEGVVAGIVDGTYSTAKIVETYTEKSDQKEYDSINGLIKQSVTTYNYDTVQMGDPTYYRHTVEQRILTEEQTIDTVYPGGSPFDTTMVRRLYKYDDVTGVRTATTTLTYYNYRGFLTLFDTQFDEPAPIGTTTARLQYYAQRERAGQGHPAIEEDSAQRPSNAVFGSNTNEDVIQARKTIVGQYKLLNGVEVNLGDLAAFENLVGTSIYNGNFAASETMLLDFTIPTAYHINCPGMNWDGLNQVWQLVLKEKALEAANAYWEIVKAECSIETAPVVGSSVRVAGMYGIVTEKHDHLDANNGLTTIVVKRLHS
jgi:hypothetical protein